MHLYCHYAHISATEMAENDARLQVLYNSEELLNRFINWLNECNNFVAVAGEPITEVQLVRISYGLIYETGQ